jgi:predicted amidohydrolase
MAASKTLRVALAQTCPVVAGTGSAPEGDDLFNVIEQNLLDARGWVEKASAERADVVVFPEYFLQGLVDNGRQVSSDVHPMPNAGGN